MLILMKVLLLFCVSEILGQKKAPTVIFLNQKQNPNLPPLLPDTYKDVFVAGSVGRPQLGSTSATCWARGGVCVDIRQCPHLTLDTTVAGCAWGHKVCCKDIRYRKPTVGYAKAYNNNKKLWRRSVFGEDLDERLRIIGRRNAIKIQGS